MQVVREKLFETNSSSSHSITLSGSPVVKPDDIFVEEDGTCRVYEGEFGWGIDEFSDAATKASYLYTYITRIAPQDSTGYLLERLHAAIKKHVKCECVEFDDSKEGYIDHQSADTAEFIFDRDKYIEDFIFNQGSTLLISNDNI